MISCSMMESFTGPEWVCTMNMSAPRMDASKRQWISPSANLRMLVSLKVTPRQEAISSANPEWVLPLTSSSRRFGIISTTRLLCEPRAM